VEPVEAAVVAEIFASYSQTGQSLMGVTKQLVAQGLLSPYGRQRWNQATVRGIVSNPSYTGTVYIGRTRHTPSRMRHSPLAPVGREHGGHPRTPPDEWMAVAQIPAIVSQEQFDLVQAKLAHNQQFARRNNTAHPYLLRALVSCGQCRLACGGRVSQSGYAYYTCRGKRPAIISCRDEKCPARYVPAQQLDELVWQDLCELLTHPEHIATALQRAQGGSWLPQELQARRENLRKARVSVEHQIERLTDAYLAGVVMLEEYTRRRQEVEQRLHAIAEQARQLEANVGRQDELAALVQSIEAFCQRVQQGLVQATFEQKRQLIELLVDRVVVTEEEVEIRYVIPTSPRSEHLRFCHLRLDYFDVPACATGRNHLWQSGPCRGKDEGVRFLVGISQAATNEQPMAPIIFPPMQHGNGRPVEEPGAFASLIHRETLPIVGLKQEHFHLCCFHPPASPIRSQYPDRFIASDCQHVRISTVF
jgi:site-specific DNA recombinase